MTHSLQSNYFLVGMLSAIVVASKYPTSGTLISPFLSKFGVTLVFLLTGMTLKLDAITEAFADVKLNALIQSLSFFAWPAGMLAIISVLEKVVKPSPEVKLLFDGLMITAALPTTVNMCVILTTDSGGNTASALANAVLGNALGIFLTPLLILARVGKTTEIDVWGTFFKLCSKVVLPVVVGQVLRMSGGVRSFMVRRKRECKQVRDDESLAT